jgi:hypothetical protein
MCEEDPSSKIVQQIIKVLGPPDADKIMRDVLRDASSALREIDESFSLVGKKPDKTLY